MHEPLPRLHAPDWFNFAAIYDRAVRNAPDPARFVEVGAWHGESTAYLAAAVRRSGKRARIAVVDPWDQFQSPPGSPPTRRDPFAAFRAAMERAGVWNILKPIRQPSLAAAATFPNRTADFVFLNAGRDYWSVAADIHAWWPKLRIGGWLGGRVSPGGNRAAADLLGPVEVIPEAASWLCRKPSDPTPGNVPLAPRIAVVTPHYAAEPAHFRDCIRSVEAQTTPCLHFVVCDGDEPVWPDGPWDGRAVRIPGPHRDGGSAARAVGSILAAAERCDAIAFLDADNWLEPEHAAHLWDAHRRTGAAVCTSGRTLYDGNGDRLGPCPEVDGDSFVDTSCLFLTQAAFGLIAAWTTVPTGAEAVCDRYVWERIRRSGIARTHTAAPTLAFRTSYAVHYRHFGRPIPPGAKVLVQDGKHTRIARVKNKNANPEPPRS